MTTPTANNTAQHTLALSQKYKDFIRNKSEAEFLEGTTAAGKTTVGIFKFVLSVLVSQKREHIISGLDTGVIEKNIINKDLGIIDIFGDYADNPNGIVHYNPAGGSGNGLPHIVVHSKSGDKIIYVLGYGDKARWKKALGGQYGCLYIDEINVADMDYVREAAMRCDYLLATLNPDDPSLPVYSEYINRSRPVKKYETDAPPELLSMLDQPVHPGWTWWYFDMDDNLGLTDAKKKQICSGVPVGTKLYKNKILGLRGRSTGLVFDIFDERQNTISIADAKKYMRSAGGNEYFIQSSIGCDTSYSSKSPDTIAISLLGITNMGRAIVLNERVYNNRDLAHKISPSDTVRNLIDFAERAKDEWDIIPRNIFIDSADQATLTEFSNYKMAHPSIWVAVPSWKKMKIVDRINKQLGWINDGDFLVTNTCENYIHELGSYSWDPNKDYTPEDGNDHMINSVQYAFIPYIGKIGGTHT